MRRPLAVASLLGVASGAWALPVGPTGFCVQYPESPSCRATAPECTYCHTIPPTRNSFGTQLEAALLPGSPRPLTPEAFTSGLAAALSAIEGLDADGDGASNLDEILAGTIPASATSVPSRGDCPSPAEQLGWDVCGPDLRYTFKKLVLTTCGRSPTRAEVEAFLAAPDHDLYLDRTLETCVRSEHWLGRDGALWRLANRKIKPTQSIKSGEGAGDIPLADYEDDYNLFVYTQTGDRDAREVLTATYHVARAEGASTQYTAYTRTPAEDRRARSAQQMQAVEVSRRAGMLTTRWFLMSNTMFTAIPRTTAAQAYRAFLGLDIAKMEGLTPVAGEPVDYDVRGVGAPECARCHSTLDPLTYPFAYYSGIGGERPRVGPSTYVDDRPSRFVQAETPAIARVPEAGVLFGQRVADVGQWARVAADSEAFARATVLDYWRLFLGTDPTPAQQATFERLWRDFMTTHDHRVERMLRALVKTEAYRVP